MSGIHWPNAGFRDLDKLYSIDWDSFTLLHYQRSYVPEIRKRYPNATILIRHYGNWWQARPWDMAQEIAGWANELREFNIEITPSNEQNLKAEGHPKGAGNGNPDQIPQSVYHDICDWNKQIVGELRKLIPWCKLHFPAQSQGHSDDQNDNGYVGFEILRPAIDLYDVLDIHTYWEADIDYASWDNEWYGQRYLKPMKLFPGKPVFISECGAHLPSSPNAAEQIRKWYASLPGIKATLFIWDSDEANAPWIIHDKPQVIEALRQPITPPTGGPMNQETFDRLTKGSGAVYVPYLGTEARYALMGISVRWAPDANNRIRVTVNDENGQPAYNVWVRHSHGNEFEHFPFTGEAVQFNLGEGSHYSEPNDPPNHITIEGLPSDEVRVGNANIIGFQHTEWQMAYQKVGAGTVIPPIITPGTGEVTRDEFNALAARVTDLEATREKVRSA